MIHNKFLSTEWEFECVYQKNKKEFWECLIQKNQ